MKVVSYYDVTTGLFNGTTLATTNERAFLHNTPPGHAAIEGEYDHLSQRVDIAQTPPVVVDYEPPQPSADHEWNATKKRWVLSDEAQERATARNHALYRIAQLESQQARAIREHMLSGKATSPGLDRLLAIENEITTLRKDL